MATSPQAEQHQCYFGILTEVRCTKPVKWFSTFGGKRTQMTWCDEHKPLPDEDRINMRHDVEPIQ